MKALCYLPFVLSVLTIGFIFYFSEGFYYVKILLSLMVSGSFVVSNEVTKNKFELFMGVVWFIIAFIFLLMYGHSIK